MEMNIRVAPNATHFAVTSLNDRVVVAWETVVENRKEIWAGTYLLTGALESGPYQLRRRVTNSWVNGPSRFSIASQSSDHSFLATMGESGSNSRSVELSIANRFGAMISPVTSARTWPPAQREHVEVAELADNMVVTWNEYQPSSRRHVCFGQLLDRFGLKMGPPIRVDQQLVYQHCHDPQPLGLPTGFAVGYSEIDTGQTDVWEGYLRFFNPQAQPRDPILHLGQANEIRLAAGHDRILAVWRTPESGCDGQYFSINGTTLTASFNIVAPPGQIGQDCAVYNGRYIVVWKNQSDDHAYGVWLNETGVTVSASFMVGPTSSWPRTVQLNDGIAVATENKQIVDLHFYRDPPPSTTSTPCALACRSLTGLPTSAGEVVTFVPSPAGISGAGIAGWVVTAVLLTITVGLGYLLIRRKAPPARDEEQPSQYATLPAPRDSHYTTMDVIHAGHDEAVREAIDLLTHTGHQLSKDGQAII